MGFQKTLSRTVEFSGIGLHSGKEVTLRVYPAPVYTGYLLKRSDLNSDLIPMLANRVKATALATTVGSEDFTVSTVEHCLSAAHALGLDNLIFEVDGPEFPIMDGSAQVFLDGFDSHGIVEQRAPKDFIVVKNEILFEEQDKEAKIIPYMGFKVSASIEFDHPVIGEQVFELEVSPANFRKEISQARTFGFFEEVEAMKSRGLVQGGSLDNAIVLSKSGLMNPEGLRYSDEFVRHKVLDAIGDLATLGRPIRGHLILRKAGHDLMNKLVKKLNDHSGAWTEQSLVY